MKKPAEIVSEAMDGADPAALAEVIGGGEATRIIWRRYHAIGALLRNERAGTVVGESFARGVAAMIEAEPAVVAPRDPSREDRARTRTITGFALAASVAAIAVLSVQVSQLNIEPAPAELAALDAAPAVTPAAAMEVTRWQTPQPEMESALNAFLVDHGEFSGATGLNGVMSYARFVSYDGYSTAH